MFSFAIVCYLFLGGAGGGLSVIAGVLALSVNWNGLSKTAQAAYRKFYTLCFRAVALMVVAGCLFLLVDAGNYDALVYLIFPKRLTILSVGVYLLVALLIVSVALSIMWQGSQRVGSRRLMMLLHVLVLVLGVSVALYTGIFLASIPSVSFWDTWLIPVLFLLSSLSCGMALALPFAWFAGDMRVLRFSPLAFYKADSIILVFELVVAVALIAISVLSGLSGETPIRAQSGLLLLSGVLSPLFIGVFVVGGLIVPLILELIARSHSQSWIWVTIACVVILGAFAMRFCIVEAGLHPVAILGGV